MSPAVQDVARLLERLRTERPLLFRHFVSLLKAMMH